MQGGLGLHVHVLSQPISPAQSSPLAQSALDVQVFPPAAASGAAGAAGSGALGSAGVAVGSVGAAAGAVPVGSDVAGGGGGFDPHAIASALTETNETKDAAR